MTDSLSEDLSANRPRIEDSLARAVGEKNKTWWAGRFYEAYYGEVAIPEDRIMTEAVNFKKGFEDWHKGVLEIFNLPQVSLGNEIEAVRDLVFEDVVQYPSVEIASIDEKIIRAQGDQEAIDKLSLRRGYWTQREQIAKKASEILDSINT